LFLSINERGNNHFSSQNTQRIILERLAALSADKKWKNGWVRSFVEAILSEFEPRLVQLCLHGEKSRKIR